MNRERTISLGEWPNLLRPGMRVYMPWSTAEPVALLDALAAAPEAARGITFGGTWIAGVNTRDITAGCPGAVQETHFVGGELAAGLQEGRVKQLPMGYRAIYQYFETGPRFDLAIVHTAPPDENGECSLGICPDFTPAALANADKVLGLINYAMPRVMDGPSVPLSRFDTIVETDTPLLTVPDGSPNALTREVAAQVVKLITDGDTLQLGIGQLPSAVMEALSGHRGLRIHSGIVISAVLDAANKGVITDAPGSITAGFAAGSAGFYAACGRDPRFAFRGVDVTHEFEVVRRISGLVGINSGLEVDLFGQVNSEFIGTRPISGLGGLGDFVRGVRAAGGKGLIALPATAKGGSVSRIVPRLATPPTLSRYETDYVVTENGAAHLSKLDTEARARALIALAAPDHREGLERAWAQMQP